MGELITPFLVASAVQAITPILLAALAGAISGQAGVFNMALEGQVLVGAFAAIAGSFFFGSTFAGVLAAVAAAAVFSLILAYGATAFRGDPVVICIGMNLLASGLTAYLLRQVFGVSGTFSDPAVVGLAKIRIAAIQAIPVLGWGFGRQTVLTWLAWALVALVSVVLFLMNLLPIPAMDGGQILLFLIEIFRGKAVPASIFWRIQIIGFSILIGLIAVVTLNDILSFPGR